MESYPNPYSAVIATFNQQPPIRDRVEDLDETDPENLSDDDLLLWANAQFTFDNQTEKDLEDEMALRIAQSQRQQYEAQRQAQQQQQQQHHQQSFQYQNFQQQQQQQQHLSQQPHSLIPPLPQQLHQQQHVQQHQQHQQQQQHHHQHQTAHTPQYPLADAPRQLQQFDAIHGYLDANSEDPRTSLSLLERSRQRNPVPPPSLILQPQQSNFDPRVHHPVYGAQPASAPGAAPHLLQPLLTHPQQQFHAYGIGASPLPSPTAAVRHDFQHLQVHGPQQQGEVILPHSLAQSSSSQPPRHDASSASISHEEKLQQLEDELQEYQSELAEERRQQGHHDPVSPSNTLIDADSADLEAFLAAEYEDEGGSPQDARSRSNSLLSYREDDPDFAAKLAAEEDKRRRNTAASARFRQKKRLREQILEKTAKEMTVKSELLEGRVRELEMEIKWLRGLVVEKDASRVLLGSKSPSSSSSPPGSTTGSVAGGLLSDSFVGPLPTGLGATDLLNSHLAGNADISATSSSRRRKTLDD